MALRFEHTFTVKARPEKVWAYLTDPYRVAPALPGAAITEKTPEGTWKGTITVKVGPVSARYRGTVRFDAIDPAARTATIAASGQDLSGRGGAELKMESRLSEKVPGETEVAMVSEVNVTGIMAQFGRGLVQDVSNQMFQKFTEAARAELEKPDEAPAVAAAAAAPLPAAATGDSPLEPAAASAAPAAAQAAVQTQAQAQATEDSQALPPAAATAPAPASASTSASAKPAPPSAPPIQVVSFGTVILARAVGRIVRRPLFWVVVVAGAGLVYWLFVR